MSNPIVQAYNAGGVASVDSVGVPVNPAPLTAAIDQVSLGATNAVTGGVSSFRTVNSTLTTMPTLVKAGNTMFYGYECYNVSSTSATYLRLYNSATTVTNAATTLDLTIIVPPVSAASHVQVAKNWYPQGIPFSNGLALRVTGDFSEANNTSIMTGLNAIQLFYK